MLIASFRGREFYILRKELRSKMSLQAVKIALTRELGANDALRKLLPDLNCLELPCIAFGPGQDIDKLNKAIPRHDLIAITSPQAAQVFLTAWNEIERPPVRVVTVGKGTSKILIPNGIQPVFEPSEFTAETLTRELPLELGRTILYPSSSLAENTLQSGLESRGFVVTRLNTYETVPSTWTDAELATARGVDIVTFASPSAIKTWAQRCGSEITAVVIGPSSLAAAKKNGFMKVFSPEGSKGIEAWAATIREVAQSMKQ